MVLFVKGRIAKYVRAAGGDGTFDFGDRSLFIPGVGTEEIWVG